MPARTRLAQLIAREEGFGIAGSLPTRRHNPGDLRHAPNASHDGIGANDIGIEPSDDAGWDDLERQLNLYAERGMSMRQVVDCYAPPNENDTQRYLDFLCDALACAPDESVAAVLTIPASV